MIDPQRWHARFLTFAAVLVVPFLRFLLIHQYGVFRAEVGVILLLSGAICAGLALVCRGTLFYVALTAAVALMSATSMQHALVPLAVVALRWILVAITIGMAAAIYTMREKFLAILLLFVAGSLLVDVGQAINWRPPPVRPSSTVAAERSRNPSHVLYLVLDEQMGPAGLPTDILECTSAKTAIERTFQKHNFTLYPFAYSNYHNTRDSLPSTINRKLLPRAGYYLSVSSRERWASKTVPENKLFAEYSARGYELSVYQSDYIDFSSRDLTVDRTFQYKANALSAIEGAAWPIPVRFRQVLGTYLQADPFIWWNLSKILPASLLLGPQKVGPLSVANIWPARIFADVVNSVRNRFVFAHLLTPHRPSIYERSGRLRDRETWDLGPPTTEDWETYLQRYAHYCEQVEFVMRQLDTFLQDLRNTGLYDSMTIIVHGDHGSRLRFVTTNMAKTIESNGIVHKDDRYDYLGTPPERDLRDRFSALFAVKRPGADRPFRLDEKGSILRFLWTAISPDSADSLPGGVDHVYLYNAEGRPVAIPMKELWK